MNEKNDYKSVCLGLDVFLDTSHRRRLVAKFPWCPPRLPAPAPMPNIQTQTSQTMSETKGDSYPGQLLCRFNDQNAAVEIIINSVGMMTD